MRVLEDGVGERAGGLGHVVPPAWGGSGPVIASAILAWAAA